MEGHKLNNSEALKFIFAGKSLVTLLNSKTGNRFTFKVKQAKDSNMFFISVLTGPENYSYIGTCIEGVYRHGKKSVISKDAQSVRVFDYVFSNLCKGALPEFIEIWHEGKCGKCGRTLTVPSSIESGFGPECSKRVKS